MRFLTGAAVAALSLAVPALSQTAAPDFSPARVKAHVDFLADDLLEGRNAGTRGYDLAAKYVATRYEALGLQPAGAGGGWYQDVPLQQSRLPSPTTDAVLIDGQRFTNGGDVLFGPSAREDRQSIEAPVVFVGFGMSAPERGIDDYKGLDVKGKYVAILTGFPKGMPSDIGAHLASEKIKVAGAHGAIGTVSVLTPTSLKAFPWKRRAAYADEPSYTWVETDGQAHVEAPAIRTGAALHGPAIDALFAGAPRSVKSVLAEAEKGGRPKGFALKTTVRIDRTSARTTVHSPNVVAVLPGADPALKNEYVLLMGHLDHDGVDPTLDGDDKIYNGAMDNAAGVATMLEAAHAMATAAERPKRSILFAAVTAEEDGLLGADYLARHPLVKDGKVVAVVNLDMPVLTYDFTDVIAFGAEHSTLGPIVERAAARDKVTLSPDPIPEQGVFTRSDHYMFVKQGVPSVFLVTGYAGAGKAANEGFEANHYHQVSDDLKVPFDWDAGAKFARINYLIAREIADAPEAPRWYEGSFFGNLFAKDQPKVPAPK